MLWGTVVYAAASLVAVPEPARSAASGGLRQRARDPGGGRLTMESATNTGRARGVPSRGWGDRGWRRARAHRAARTGARDVLRDYLALTKPRIIVLLLITTVATMFVADPSGPSLATILWTMLGGYLAAGGAGAINHFLDRDRDARMARTCDRPLVAGRIEPRQGLLFGIAPRRIASVPSSPSP